MNPFSAIDPRTMGNEEDTEKVIIQKKALQPDGKSISEVSSLSSDSGSIDARSSTSAPATQGRWRQWFGHANTVVIAVALLLLFFLMAALIGAAIAAAVVMVEATQS